MTKKWRRWGLILVIALAIGGVGYWLGHRGNSAGAAPPDDGKQETVAAVKVAPIEHTRITETAVAYGSVVAQQGKANFVSVLFECVVHHVLVAPGEAVVEGQPLLSLGPSQAAQLKIDQARANLAAAQKGLQQTQERFNLEFATNQDLAQAQAALQTAQLEWDNLKGIQKETTLNTTSAGLVSRIDVQDGQVVPAGQPLLELVARDQIEVKLGVEPEDAHYLAVGAREQLFPVYNGDTAHFEGTIRLVAQRINPATHLVEVYVTPPGDVRLSLNAFLRAELGTASAVGLVVPRSAVYPEGDHDVLFIVANGHAVRRPVRIGLQTKDKVEVDGIDLHAGDQAVVEGNHELTDGMAVKESPQH